MKLKWIMAGVGLWLFGAVLAVNGGFRGMGDMIGRIPEAVQAATQSEQTQVEINDANAAVQQLQQEKRNLASDLEDIEKQKSNLLKYIKTLDSKVAKMTEQIQDTQEKIAITEEEIALLAAQEAQVTEKMNQQYEMMKTRIKCIYEESDDGYLELLMGSASLSDLFNRMEYMSKVNDYDSQMLNEYRDTQSRLAATQLEKQQKMESLQTTEETLTFEKDSVKKMLGKKTAQLKQYNNLIDESEVELDNYNAEIAKKSEELESLLSRQRQEIAAEEAAAARKAAEAAKENQDSEGTQDSEGEQDSEEGEQGSEEGQETPEEPSGASASGFVWPLAAAGRISCGFGPRQAPTAGASTYHKGVDIAVPTGTAVRASKAGKVVIATYSSSAGNYVGLYHGNGIYTYYMHCSSLSVSVGQEVEQGQTVALSGSTGISTGPHLHFAINIDGQYVNPLSYVSR